MYGFIIALTVLTAILLIGIVLIQKSKGGGLSSQFGGVNSVFGVRQTNSRLESITWTLAGIIVVLSIASAFTMPSVSSSTAIRTQAPGETPAAPANQFDTQIPAAPAEEAPAVEAVEAANAAAAEVSE